MKNDLRFACIVLIGLAFASPAIAQQETRDAERQKAQAEKAKDLQPYVPTKLERRIEAAGKLLQAPTAFYVAFGSVYRGGGFAIGPGFRTGVGTSGTFDVHGNYSLRQYKFVGTTLQLPSFARDMVKIGLHAEWNDAPRVEYYGLGIDTVTEDKTRFHYRATSGGVTARIQPVPVVAIGGGIDYLDVDTRPGRSGTSIEQRFDAISAPGLGISPTYRVSTAFAEIDWRSAPLYTRRGGLYRVAWSQYDQTSTGIYEFDRVDVDLSQYVPLLRENWVLAFHGRGSFTNTDAGNVVPYFLMPSLGGSSDLRGYRSWRFRDRNSLLLTGEYRWIAGRAVDMALFLDAGKVAARRDDLDLKDLKRSYGIGIRFHSPLATILRIELAKTQGEGLGLVFAVKPPF